MTNGQRTEFKGIAASPGFAIAKAYVYIPEETAPERLTVDRPSDEQQRFHEALKQTEQELVKLRDHTAAAIGADKAEIFDGHLMLLHDPELTGAISDNIGSQRISAEYALHEVASMFIQLFEGMDDELLRARAADVRDLARRLMAKLTGDTVVSLSELSEPCVIIADDLTPSDTALLNPAVVKGFAAASGSRTSHSAIMARSMEIPAIVGFGKELLSLSHGASVILDASTGILIEIGRAHV